MGGFLSMLGGNEQEPNYQHRPSVLPIPLKLRQLFGEQLKDDGDCFTGKKIDWFGII